MWRPLPGFPGYWVSSEGEISRKGGPRHGVLKKGTHPKGYRYVLIRLDGRRCTDRKKTKVYVHRAMCEAFHGPPPPGPHHAHHRNKIRDDNRLENLEWKDCVNQNHIPDPPDIDKYPSEEDA